MSDRPKYTDREFKERLDNYFAEGCQDDHEMAYLFDEYDDEGNPIYRDDNGNEVTEDEYYDELITVTTHELDGSETVEKITRREYYMRDGEVVTDESDNNSDK